TSTLFPYTTLFRSVMRLGGPVDAHEPVALVLHHADPHAVGAAAMSTGPCTGAQGRRLPTGLHRGHSPGHGSPPQVLEAQGVVGRSQQVGPIRTAYDSSIRITMRRTGSHIASSLFHTVELVSRKD